MFTFLKRWFADMKRRFFGRFSTTTPPPPPPPPPPTPIGYLFSRLVPVLFEDF